ncbi:MAG: hypothetical protein ABIG69_06920 [Bacteroidota bacterium]
MSDGTMQKFKKFIKEVVEMGKEDDLDYDEIPSEEMVEAIEEHDAELAEHYTDAREALKKGHDHVLKRAGK